MFILAFFTLIKSNDDLCNATLKSKKCMACVYASCGFCRDDRQCYELNSTSFENCKDKSSKKDLACVKELGGDADPKVRYIVGAVFIALALIIDFSVRIFGKNIKTGDSKYN